MLREIRYENFRAIRDAHLPLSPVTVIVGPNGGGKSTVLQSLQLFRQGGEYEHLISVDRKKTAAPVVVSYVWDAPGEELKTVITWVPGSSSRATFRGTAAADEAERRARDETATRVRVFAFDPAAIARSVNLVPDIELQPSGEGLSGVLDGLRDAWPDSWESLNSELARWLPEFDRIVFSVPSQGMRAFGLRRKFDGLNLFANDLSGGTLFSVALLTLAHLPQPPELIGLEEPDHGIHPRLLRRVQDAIHRLAYPSNYGEKRLAAQVVVTTHSPYFLDLFKDHPEEVIVANKGDAGVTFQRLTDRPKMDEILPEGPLGELWYSGLLGGVPAEPVQP